MKQLLVIFVLFLLLFESNAQGYKPSANLNYQKIDEKSVHFGFTLGLNNMDFSIYNSGKGAVVSEQVVFSPGFTVGIVSDLRLHKNLSLRFLPSLEFGQHEIEYLNLPEKRINVESVLVNLPMAFKYRSKRINNYRPYVVGGFCYKIDAQPQTRLVPKDKILIRLEPDDTCLELGAGIDFYLPYFKLSTELKFSVGFKDILNHEYDLDNPDYEAYTNAIDKMNSKVVSLLFHFE